MAAHVPVAVGEPPDRVGARVGLVLDLADDLLEDVLDGDDPDRAAVLVDDDRHRAALALELGEQVVERLRLGHDRGVADRGLDRGVGAGVHVEAGDGSCCGRRRGPGPGCRPRSRRAGCGRRRRSAAARPRRSPTASTVTTAGIGVITSRASCSCRWKTPCSIVASFSLDVALAAGGRDQQRAGRRRRGAPRSARDRRRTGARSRSRPSISAQVKGAETTRKQVQRRATSARAMPSARLIATIFGTCSPTVMWSGGRDREGEDQRDRRRGAVLERALEQRLEQRGDRGLAEEADADRGHRDPELAGGQVLVDASRAARAPRRRRGRPPRRALDPAAAGADERELGRDEEPVEQHEDEQRGECERRHSQPPRNREPKLILRGRSSSVIGRPR